MGRIKSRGQAGIALPVALLLVVLVLAISGGLASMAGSQLRMARLERARVEALYEAENGLVLWVVSQQDGTRLEVTEEGRFSAEAEPLGPQRFRVVSTGFGRTAKISRTVEALVSVGGRIQVTDWKIR